MVKVTVALSAPVKLAPLVGATDTPTYRVSAVPLVALVAIFVCAPTEVDIAVRPAIAAGVLLACMIESFDLAKLEDTYALTVFVLSVWLVNIGVS